MIVLLPILLGVIVSLGTAASAVGLTVRGSVYHLGAAVKPGAGLGDGQFVRVTWHGLGPQQPVFFRQCTAKPTNTGRDCTALYSDTGFTGATAPASSTSRCTAACSAARVALTSRAR